MKVCPKCQASFAEGFVYCPQDAEPLARYDLRARLLELRLAEFNLLLPPNSLWQRLRRECAFAWRELRRDPSSFLADLLRGERSSKRRKYLLQAGVALAVIAYTVVVTALLLAGLARTTPAEQVAPVELKAEDPEEYVRLVMPVTPISRSETTRERNGQLGGSLLEPQRAGGGGGGGAQTNERASAGAPPAPSLSPQLRAPTFDPPSIPNASLLTPMTVNVDPRALLMAKLRLGDPSGAPAPPAPGQGSGGGLGNGAGTGVGDGDGDGVGKGRNGGFGGGLNKRGGGETNGPGHDGGIQLATGRLRPTILYKERARFTEEARQQKIQGSVLLSVVFLANGQIGEVRVVRGLPAGLTEEAIQAAKRIRFNPASQHGAPISVRAQLEFNFALY
jgi:TonB family protein